MPVLSIVDLCCVVHVCGCATVTIQTPNKTWKASFLLLER